MAVNNDPIYSKKGDIQWITGIVTANNNLNLVTGTNYLIFTAEATYGGYVSEVRIRPNPSQNTAATVARLWLHNGAGTGTLTAVAMS